MLTVLDHDATDSIDGLFVAADRLLGWERKPYGWCKGDACLPNFRAQQAETPDGIDVLAFADLIGKVAVADEAEGVIAFADKSTGLEHGRAPDFAELVRLRGRKVAVVFWASWCGCRYDLKAWEERHHELAPHGFSVLSVSLDRNREDARPWLDGLTHPSVIDEDGRIAELYNVINVPTVVWVDEAGMIARPQDTMTATDTFRSMNGISSEKAMTVLHRWVTTDSPGMDAQAVRDQLRIPSAAEQRARAHGRIAAWLLGRGRTAAAAAHREEAARLAPHDVAIRRGLMPLAGEDPFGEGYFALREELERKEIPIYRPLPDWSA